MAEGDLLGRFFQGLKTDVKMEFLKMQVPEFEYSIRISFRVDSALWSSTNYMSTYWSVGNTHNLMEFGNVHKTSSEVQMRQRELDLRNNASVVCHTIISVSGNVKGKVKQVSHVEARKYGDIIDTVTFDDDVDFNQEN